MAQAAVGLIGGAYSASQQRSAARDATRAAERGAAAERAERQRMYDMARGDQQPYLQAGADAQGRQNAFLAGDMSGFENDAAYRFNTSQMQQGLERGAAARGRLYSGGTSADLAGLMSGLAANQADSYWNRLSGLTNSGQSAANSLGVMGASMASGNANSINNATGQRIGSRYDQANANTGFAAGALGLGNNWYQQQRANNGGGSPWYFGNQPGRG